MPGRADRGKHSMYGPGGDTRGWTACPSVSLFLPRVLAYSGDSQFPRNIWEKPLP